MPEACQLTVIERDESEAPAPTEQPAERPADVSDFASIHNVPEELTAAQWRELDGRFQWHKSCRSLLFRPEVLGFPGD